MANCNKKWKFSSRQHIMIMLMKFSTFTVMEVLKFMSSGKRRDKKNRVLRNGEIQLSNGRYRFKYINFDGKENYIYSWRLVDTDPTPSGKRKGPSLRELEEKIQYDLNNGCATFGNKITVLELVKDYVDFKKNTVRKTTQAGYMTVINLLKKDPFGAKRIDTVTVFDAKKWLAKLQTEDNRSYSSITSIRGVLKPAFQAALNDDLVRRNPFEFMVSEVVFNDTKKRLPLTTEQEEAFLGFVKNNKYYSKYYEGMYILFNTGMRISEFCGLTIDDINFENHTIDINKQLMKKSKKYYLQDTKTSSGTRVIPMSEEVENCFKTIIENRPNFKREPTVDGIKGFLTFDAYGSIAYSLHWEKHFKYATDAYNRTNDLQIKCLTPHVCRHTYCTRMAMLGMNPKTLQYLMGHSEVDVTLNVYTHVGLNDAKKELKRLNLA